MIRSLFILGLFLLSSPIFGQSLSFSNPPSSFEWHSTGYNPRAFSTVTKVFSFDVSNTGSSNLFTFIEATRGQNSTQTGSGSAFPRAAKHTSQNKYLFYQLYATTQPSEMIDNRIWLDIATHTNGGQIPAAGMDANTTRTQSFIMEIPAGQLSPSGVYEDTFTISLREGFVFFPAPTPPVTLDVTIRIEVFPYVYFDIISGNTISVSTELDFEEMTPNESISVDFELHSNLFSDVDVTFDSENEGNLEHPTLPGQIPYTMNINLFTPYVLNTSTPEVLQFDFDFGQLQARNLSFHLPASIPKVAAGTYSDTITITVEAQ